jgi:hypothetical protein
VQNLPSNHEINQVYLIIYFCQIHVIYFKAEGLERSTKCRNCFVSHFPRPNSRTCKNRKHEESTKILPYRLRGGADVNGMK